MLLAPFLWFFCEFDEKVLDNLSLGRQKKAFCKIKYQISKVGRGLIDKKIF